MVPWKLWNFVYHVANISEVFSINDIDILCYLPYISKARGILTYDILPNQNRQALLFDIKFENLEKVNTKINRNCRRRVQDRAREILEIPVISVNCTQKSSFISCKTPEKQLTCYEIIYHWPGALPINILTSNKKCRTCNAASSSNGHCGETAQHIDWMSASDLFVGYIWSLMGSFHYECCVYLKNEQKGGVDLKFIDGWSTYRVNTLIEKPQIHVYAIERKWNAK